MGWNPLHKKITPSTERWTVVAYRSSDGGVVPSNEFFTKKERAEYWANTHSHFVIELYERDGISPWFAIPASEAHLNGKERTAIFLKLFQQADRDYPTYYRLVDQHITEAARR